MALKKKEVKPAENNVLDEEKYIDDLVSKVSAAQKIFATYSQEQVDEIFKRVALKMSSLRIPLAQMAAEEAGWALWKTKLSKTISPPNIFTTNIKTPKPAACWKKTR